MEERRQILGFLHFRTDLGDGIRTGVFFNFCNKPCSVSCVPCRFLKEHPFADVTCEKSFYDSEELIQYLQEEKLWCYTKKLGISFMGREPLADPHFCYRVGCGVKDAEMDLQIWSCATITETAFDMLYGVADLFVLNLYSVVDFGPKPFPGYCSRDSVDLIRYLDRHGFPYRLRIPVIKGINHNQGVILASFSASLSKVKSVILDFSGSSFSEEEKENFRYHFLKRNVVLY